jgi:hypothetical protein
VKGSGVIAASSMEFSALRGVFLPSPGVAATGGGGLSLTPDGSLKIFGV